MKQSSHQHRAAPEVMQKSEPRENSVDFILGLYAMPTWKRQRHILSESMCCKKEDESKYASHVDTGELPLGSPGCLDSVQNPNNRNMGALSAGCLACRTQRCCFIGASLVSFPMGFEIYIRVHLETNDGCGREERYDGGGRTLRAAKPYKQQHMACTRHSGCFSYERAT